MIVALYDPVDRPLEYRDDPRHTGFIVEELLPALEKRYPILDRPKARGLMGASYGALGALASAWRHPGVFDRLLLQSCSFAFPNTDEFEVPAVGLDGGSDQVQDRLHAVLERGLRRGARIGGGLGQERLLPASNAS